MFEDKDEVQKAVMELKLFSGMASGEFATEEDILDSTGEVAAQVNYRINYSLIWWSDSVKSTFVSAQPKNHSKPLQICLGCPKKILSSIGACEQSSLWVLCFDEFTF